MTSRWWRAYDDALHDPKVQALPPVLFKFWFNLLCVASKNGGLIPPLSELKTVLKARLDHVKTHVEALLECGLLDEIDGRLEPHNWRIRQYKSDNSTDRVRGHRSHKRNVSETPPDTEYRIQKERAEPTAPTPGASDDPRTRLFRDGLAKLASLTGKGPDACRSFVGKCLKSAGDDAVTVLGLIEEAERNRVVDPSGWIVAHLKQQGNSNGTHEPKPGSVPAIAKRWAEKFESQSGDGFEGHSGAVFRLPQR
jgi:hypothetical protein